MARLSRRRWASAAAASGKRRSMRTAGAAGGEVEDEAAAQGELLRRPRVVEQRGRDQRPAAEDVARRERFDHAARLAEDDDRAAHPRGAHAVEEGRLADAVDRQVDALASVAARTSSAKSTSV